MPCSRMCKRFLSCIAERFLQLFVYLALNGPGLFADSSEDVESALRRWLDVTFPLITVRAEGAQIVPVVSAALADRSDVIDV